MKVKLVADGSAKWQRMIKRWGIAFLIGDDVLFDTFGDARVFMSNVRKQKINLSKIRHVVISHDDWDHIAGLWSVLKEHKDLKVYVVPHFKVELKDKIRSFGVTLVETPEPTMIREGVYTSGELSGGSGRGILYEQAVVIKEEGGKLGVLTGCAHPKLPDILRAVRGHFHQNIGVAIGGFHLKDMELDQIREIVESLPKLGVCHVFPLHCTGRLAVKEFKRFYGEHYHRLREGDSIEV